MCFPLHYDRYNSNQPNKILLVYQAYVFVYTLTILILSIFANQQSKTLSAPYVDAIEAWDQNPIYEIYKAESCSSGSEQFFILNNRNTQYTKWWHTSAFSLCLTRLPNYNFVNSNQTIIKEYQVYPKCLADEEICGGVYVQNKYCAPKGKCPYNSLLFVTSAELAKLDQSKYTTSIQIESDFYIAMSSLAESQPIYEISIFGSKPCLPSQFSNYDVIFSSAYCQEDPRFKILNEVTQANYASANGFTSAQTSKVGVYSRSYTEILIECRQRNLVNWGSRTLKDQKAAEVVQPMLMVLSAVDFAVIGFFYSLFHFLQYQYKQRYNPYVVKTMWIIKILVSYFHAIMITLAFGLWMDIKLFLTIMDQAKCTDSTTLQIIKDELKSIEQIWRLNLVMFLIFVFYALIECGAFSVYLDRAMKKKETQLVVPQNLSSVNQSQLSYQQVQLYQYFRPSDLSKEQQPTYQVAQQPPIEQSIGSPKSLVQSQQMEYHYQYYVPDNYQTNNPNRDLEFQSQSQAQAQNQSPSKRRSNVQSQASPASNYESFKGVQRPAYRYDNKISEDEIEHDNSANDRKYQVNK